MTHYSNTNQWAMSRIFSRLIKTGPRVSGMKSSYINWLLNLNMTRASKSLSSVWNNMDTEILCRENNSLPKHFPRINAQLCPHMVFHTYCKPHLFAHSTSLCKFLSRNTTISFLFLSNPLTMSLLIWSQHKHMMCCAC